MTQSREHGTGLFETEEKQFAKVIAKTWKDGGFRSRLIANPRQVLQEEGLSIPADLNVTITPDAKTALALGLPDKPPGFGKLP